MADAADTAGATSGEPTPGHVAAVYEYSYLGALVAAALESPAVARDAPERAGLARAHAIIRERRAGYDPGGVIRPRFAWHVADLGSAPAERPEWFGRLAAQANQAATADGVTMPDATHGGANSAAVEALLVAHASFYQNTGASRPTSAQTPALCEAERPGLGAAAALVEHRLYVRDPRGEVRRRVLAAHGGRLAGSLLSDPPWRALWGPLEGGIP